MSFHIIYGISKEEAKKIPRQRIKVLKDLPPIFGIDGEIYRLKKGDIAAIPKDTAKLLIQRKVAIIAKNKTKKARIPRKIRKIQASRSKRARTLDALRTAKQVLPLSKYEQWAKNPGRYDLIGVDTANAGKRKTHRKKPLWEVILTKRTIMEMPGECYGVPEQKRVRGRGDVPSDVVKSKCTERERECMKIYSYKKLGEKEKKKKKRKIPVKRKITKTKTKGRMRRYKVWGEWPATKEPRYYFARSKPDLLHSLSPLAQQKIKEGKIKVEYDGIAW